MTKPTTKPLKRVKFDAPKNGGRAVAMHQQSVLVGAKPSAGQRIIAGLKDAIAGNFAAVTIDGQQWVRTEFANHEFWLCGSNDEWKSIPPGLSRDTPPVGYGAAACCPMVVRR